MEWQAFCTILSTSHLTLAFARLWDYKFLSLEKLFKCLFLRVRRENVGKAKTWQLWTLGGFEPVTFSLLERFLNHCSMLQQVSIVASQQLRTSPLDKQKNEAVLRHINQTEHWGSREKRKWTLNGSKKGTLIESQQETVVSLISLIKHVSQVFYFIGTVRILCV